LLSADTLPSAAVVPFLPFLFAHSLPTANPEAAFRGLGCALPVAPDPRDPGEDCVRVAYEMPHIRHFVPPSPHAMRLRREGQHGRHEKPLGFFAMTKHASPIPMAGYR